MQMVEIKKFWQSNYRTVLFGIFLILLGSIAYAFGFLGIWQRIIGKVPEFFKHTDTVVLSTYQLALVLLALLVTSAIGLIAYINERKKKAELVSVALYNAQLYTSAYRLAAIVESSNDAIYSIDLSGVIDNWNAGAQRLYGYYSEEVIGKPLSILLPPEKTDDLDMFLDAAKNDKGIHNLETVRARKDGHKIDVSINVSPTKDLRGRVVGASIIAHDVTETKAAREALIAKEAALREAQRIAHVGSWELDIATNQLTWSDEMYQLYGLKATTDMPNIEQLTKYVHPNDHEKVKQIRQAALSSGEPFEYDYRIIRDDGTYLILQAQGRVHTDKMGKAVKLSGTVQDVTEQRLSEEITRYNEEKLKMLIESVSEYAIFTLDKTGRVTSWNSGAQKITGYTENEILGENFSIFYPKEDALAGRPELELEVAARTGHYEEEGWRVRKNGQRYWSSVVVNALHNNAGELVGFSKVTRDRTERKKLEEMKSDFISMVSHQLKTPLAILRGYADNLLLGITGPLTERQKQYLEEMREISNRYYALIARLLSVSRMERGTVPLDRNMVELKTIVEEVLANHRHSIGQKGLELRIDGLDEPILVMADIEKTSEAISNVLDNAIKFTGEGSIEILAGTDGTNGWLEVRDSGPGVAEEDLAKLFKRDQIMSGAPKSQGGTGLGLYIAKEFMLMQSGDVAVESELGSGTKFTFSLPLAKVDIESEANHG